MIPNQAARGTGGIFRVSSRYASFAGIFGTERPQDLLKSSKTRLWQAQIQAICPLRQGAGVEHGKVRNALKLDDVFRS